MLNVPQLSQMFTLKCVKALDVLCTTLYVININYSKCSQEIPWFRLTYRIYGQNRTNRGYTVCKMTRFALP